MALTYTNDISDALDLHYVYEWRREQEHSLRAEKGPGTGMSDEKVNHFVDNCTYLNPKALSIYAHVLTCLRLPLLRAFYQISSRGCLCPFIFLCFVSGLAG